MQTKPFEDIQATPVEPKLPACYRYQPWTRKYIACYVRYVCRGGFSIYFYFLDFNSINFILADIHYAGTNKMGSREDPTAVVDERLRVIGAEGLRVADASIMPTITRGNTMVPTIMIGEKAADMIRDDWSERY